MICDQCQLAETCQVKRLYEIDLITYNEAQLVCVLVRINERGK